MLDQVNIARLGVRVPFRYTPRLRSKRGKLLLPSPHLMPQQLKEIWYFEQSFAAPLAGQLKRRYAFRILPRSSRGRRMALPKPGEARVVRLADLGEDDLAILRRLARSDSRVRLIGISRNGLNSAPAAGCFATLPRKAHSALVRKTAIRN